MAAGVYTPTTGSDRTASITLRDGVMLYGGFAGSETACSQRDWNVHLTSLSGDIGVQGDKSDNSYHVVSAGSTLTQTVELYINSGSPTLANLTQELGEVQLPTPPRDKCCTS